MDAEEIDRTDILSARMKAMQLAIDRLNPTADFASSTQPGPGTQRRHHHGTQDDCKGRQLVSVYRGGSILAKVSRDHWDGPGGGGVPSVPV